MRSHNEARREMSNASDSLIDKVCLEYEYHSSLAHALQYIILFSRVSMRPEATKTREDWT